MGGGGGGSWRDIDPDELAGNIRESENEARIAAFETEINDYLGTQLTIYNDRDVETVRRILSQILSDLETEVEGSFDLLFGGSVAKHTYIDGLSDIDALVFFDRTELADSSPTQLRELLADIMRERYGDENINVGNLAITAHLEDHMLQLLPAIHTEDGYKISTADGQGWASIQPDKFSEELTALNRATNGKLVPTIKLAKVAISHLPEQQQLSGYHVESLALEAFKNYDGPQTNKAMLRHFFEQASSLVTKPIGDPTGQSNNVDDYLGPDASIERRNVSLALERVARRIQNADGMRSIDHWKQILGDD